MKDKFKLLKTFNEYKKGEIFDSFGGLVYGLSSKESVKINFKDTEYFLLVE